MLRPHTGGEQEKLVTDSHADPYHRAVTIGELLRRYRRDAGMTQEELAERAEVSARTISDVERGTRTRLYRDTADRLAGALGLDPARHATFAAAARGKRLPLATATPLPIAPTRLIGRERELEIVTGALARADIRILTLTGPGGIGKTRLALEAAARTAHLFAGGVRFVPLGTIEDERLFLATVARAVGVSGARETTVEAIAAGLGPGRTLLLLDTFEHLMARAADVAALFALGETTVLATSREALRIRGEHEVVVPALDLPVSATPDDISVSGATTLFVERALAVKPSLTIDQESARLIAEICRRLGGLPLAIELAAARTRHLTLTELSERLGTSLRVLTGGPRDLPRRQQTMRDTIAWSYELLTASEQSLLRDLSVFRGGWTALSAAAVCDRDIEVDLAALRDKSLVERARDGGTRFDMLDAVREFGAEAGASHGAEDRHLAYFLALAESAESEIVGLAQAEWLDRLDREHDNLRAALGRALAAGRFADVLRIASAVWRFWLLRGHLAEGRRWLRDGLAASGEVGASLRLKALWASAWLSYHLGDYEATRRDGEEMQEIVRGSDDRVAMRNALTVAGIVELAAGRYAEATQLFDRCVELLRAREPDWLTATSLMTLGMATTHGRDPRAGAVLAEARELYVRSGDQHFATRAVLYTAYDRLLGGDADAAARLFRECLVTFWELDDLWGTAEALEGIAATAGLSDRAESAAVIAGAADALRERLSSRPLASDHAVLERALARAAAATPNDTAMRACVAAGHAMSVEEAVDRALRE